MDTDAVKQTYEKAGTYSQSSAPISNPNVSNKPVIPVPTYSKTPIGETHYSPQLNVTVDSKGNIVGKGNIGNVNELPSGTSTGRNQYAQPGSVLAQQNLQRLAQERTNQVAQPKQEPSKVSPAAVAVDQAKYTTLPTTNTSISYPPGSQVYENGKFIPLSTLVNTFNANASNMTVQQQSQRINQLQTYANKARATGGLNDVVPTFTEKLFPSKFVGEIEGTKTSQLLFTQPGTITQTATTNKIMDTSTIATVPITVLPKVVAFNQMTAEQKLDFLGPPTTYDQKLVNQLNPQLTSEQLRGMYTNPVSESYYAGVREAIAFRRQNPEINIVNTTLDVALTSGAQINSFFGNIGYDVYLAGKASSLDEAPNLAIPKSYSPYKLQGLENTAYDYYSGLGKLPKDLTGVSSNIISQEGNQAYTVGEFVGNTALLILPETKIPSIILNIAKSKSLGELGENLLLGGLIGGGSYVATGLAALTEGTAIGKLAIPATEYGLTLGLGGMFVSGFATQAPQLFSSNITTAQQHQNAFFASFAANMAGAELTTGSLNLAVPPVKNYLIGRETTPRYSFVGESKARAITLEGETKSQLNARGILNIELTEKGTGVLNKGKIYDVTNLFEPLKIKAVIGIEPGMLVDLTPEIVTSNYKYAKSNGVRTFASDAQLFDNLNQLMSKDIVTIEGTTKIGYKNTSRLYGETNINRFIERTYIQPKKGMLVNQAELETGRMNQEVIELQRELGVQNAAQNIYGTLEENTKLRVNLGKLLTKNTGANDSSESFTKLRLFEKSSKEGNVVSISTKTISSEVGTKEGIQTAVNVKGKSFYGKERNFVRPIEVKAEDIKINVGEIENGIQVNAEQMLNAPELQVKAKTGMSKASADYFKNEFGKEAPKLREEGPNAGKAAELYTKYKASGLTDEEFTQKINELNQVPNVQGVRENTLLETKTETQIEQTKTITQNEALKLDVGGLKGINEAVTRVNDSTDVQTLFGKFKNSGGLFKKPINPFLVETGFILGEEYFYNVKLGEIPKIGANYTQSIKLGSGLNFNVGTNLQASTLSSTKILNLTNTSQKTNTLTSTQLGINTKTLQGIQTNVAEATRVAEATNTQTAQQEATQTKTVTATKTMLKTNFDIVNPVITGFPTFFPPNNKKDKSKANVNLNKMFKGFQGYIRKKGKFVKVSNNILPEGLAYREAANVARSTLAQSITVREAGLTDIQDSLSANLQDFRRKALKSKIREEPVYIQKNPLGSKTEVRQIQQAKADKHLRNMIGGRK